jgi:hypothetical protein
VNLSRTDALWLRAYAKLIEAADSTGHTASREAIIRAMNAPGMNKNSPEYHDLQQRLKALDASKPAESDTATGTQ